MGFYEQSAVKTVDTSSFAARVYGWMTLGLALSGVIAFSLAMTGLYVKLMPLCIFWALGAFGIGMSINFIAKNCKPATLTTLFLLYAALEGMLFGTILPVFAATYGGGLIWTAFASAAVIFGTTALYGTFTKSDMTGIGRILMMGLIGLIALTVVQFILSFFFPVHGLTLLISYLGLAIFVGLTAYDAQNIRRMSQQADNSVVAYKLSILMALKMYINVIMIFWYLLHILSSGQRR